MQGIDNIFVGVDVNNDLARCLYRNNGQSFSIYTRRQQVQFRGFSDAKINRGQRLQKAWYVPDHITDTAHAAPAFSSSVTGVSLQKVRFQKSRIEWLIFKRANLPAMSCFMSSVMISVTTPTTATASPASVNFSSSVLFAAAIFASLPNTCEDNITTFKGFLGLSILSENLSWELNHLSPWKRVKLTSSPNESSTKLSPVAPNCESSAIPDNVKSLHCKQLPDQMWKGLNNGRGHSYYLIYLCPTHLVLLGWLKSLKRARDNSERCANARSRGTLGSNSGHNRLDTRHTNEHPT